MSDHTALINRFYTAFAARDPAGMVACYHPGVAFHDPAFLDLKGWRAAAMWTMLCERAEDLRIEHSAVTVDGDRGTAHWEAWYTFSATGRKVHNVIDATFEFKDGLIVSHRDHFEFWRWSRQALGPPGVFLGWSSVLSKKVNAQANKGLDLWIEKNNAGPELMER